MSNTTRLHGVYWYACPHCGGPIGDDRLFARLPCASCLPDAILEKIKAGPDGRYDPRIVAKVLSEIKPIPDSEYIELARLEEEVERAEELFKKAIGSGFWSVQRMWLRRLLRGKSFAAIAPTGIGKTTFGVFAAVYLAATKGYKSYIVVPTTPLVQQVEERARRFAEAIGADVRILAFHTRLSQKERRERKRALLECDFDILITTSAFMLRNLDTILSVLDAKCGQRFYMVFVDDVDSVLKSSKSVDAVLRIVGFTQHDIELGLELLKLRREIARLSAKAQASEEARRKLHELTARARELEKYFEEKRSRLCTGPGRDCISVLIVSSATGRPRGTRVRLFSVMLGFEAGSRPELYRNIVDAYVKPEGSIEDEVVKLVKLLGDGGLVYVPVDKGTAYAEKLAEILREHGIRAEAFTARNPAALERFRRGETQVLVGVAIYYGVAVRGLDLPERIRYAVFAGIPRHKFSARFEEPHPTSIMRALALLAEHGPEDVKSDAEKLLARLRRLYRRLSAVALQRVAEELRSGKVESEAARAFSEALEFIRRVLTRSDVWDALKKAPGVSIVTEDGKSYIMIPDVATYIQASGRTSRLYAGGITKGLSVIIVDDEKLLEGLRRRLKWYIAEADIKPLNEIDLESLLREIDEDRRKVRDVMEGRVKPEYLELVKTAMLIVESPNKARTIAQFFGRPSVREIAGLRAYEVSTGDFILTIIASGGHVYDLVKTYVPLEYVSRDWLMRFRLRGVESRLDKHVSGFDWSTAVNKHGVFVAKHGVVRYLPVYTPLARCPECGYQGAVNPDLLAEEEEKVRRLLELRIGKEAYKITIFDENGLPLVCPRCGSPSIRTSLQVIRALRELASEVDIVMIGTDPDTEGEKIGWDVAALIAPFARKIVRVEFHEITRRAILEAIRNPRDFNPRLVEAQIVRRVEDRWIGFTLSPLLWHDFWVNKFCRSRIEEIERKLRELEVYARGRRIHPKVESLRKRLLKRLERLKQICMDERGEIKPNYNLSAGRVQTPVLGWIVEHYTKWRRESEACSKVAKGVVEGCPRILATLEGDGVKLEVEVRGEHAKQLRVGALVQVNVVREDVVEVYPPPPYTTDAMLADAWNILRIPAPTAMQLAQDLFEMGFITYHRTDSTRVSDVGINVAREYLSQMLDPASFQKLFTPRRWEPKKLIGIEAAHEAIRPTRPIDAVTLRRLIEEGVIETPRPLTRRHLALYDMIFRRFIASQMAPAKVRVQEISVAVGGVEVARIERHVELVEKGFVTAYEIGESLIRGYTPLRLEPPVKPGAYRVVELHGMPETWPLTQAEVVKLMKDRRIGRPSTYAKIVKTLFDRKYVTASKRKQWLIPTTRGLGVYRYLVEDLGSRIPAVRDMISEERTRELLEKMDYVEEGERDYQELLEEVEREISEVEKLLSELLGQRLNRQL